ncbi:MAG: MBL fold metallo-hydrolase [Nitrospinota bacterium]
MRVTVLGCGTSTGVPSIGCGCAVCTSSHPRNHRTRPSVVLEEEGRVLLVDTSPDFRLQALRHGLRRVDAVLYTHFHADHTHGIDDLRIFNLHQRQPIPCHGTEETLEGIRQNFRYIFEAEGDYQGFQPQLTLHPLNGPTVVAGFPIVPLNLVHRTSRVLGIRVGGFAYLTDCNAIPEESMERLGGLRHLILDALRHRPHPAHMTVAEALEVVRRLKPAQTYLTHTNHELDYEETNRKLPPGVELAYDGLSFTCD